MDQSIQEYYWDPLHFLFFMAAPETALRREATRRNGTRNKTKSMEQMYITFLIVFSAIKLQVHVQKMLNVLSKELISGMQLPFREVHIQV